jgi:hypothetical protein
LQEVSFDMRIASGFFVAFLVVTFFICGIAAQQDASSDRIRLIVREDQRRVDILVNGQPFTSYIWPTTLAKPVLYPLRSARGTIVTRGYPLEPRPGERTDHPHHAGMWFNYGSVNGIDFWNNSDAIKPQDKPKMGTVDQRKIIEARSGQDQAELVVETDWNTADQKTLLKEHTRLVFRGDATTRTIDRITTLTAQGEKVVFEDDKEGLLGLRVARSLEMPSDKPEILTDASGRPTTVPKLANTGVNGVYLTSEGKTGDAAWGTRGKWCNLSGTVEGEAVTISIFDHPSNSNFPAYWHARGYGLFAVNPLGRKIFTNGKEPALNFTLAPNESVTFRYRVLITSGQPTPEGTEKAYNDFAAHP